MAELPVRLGSEPQWASLKLKAFCPLYKKVMVKLHDTATECHLSYGITQCYLLPDTSEHTPPSPQPDRLVLDLPTI